MLAVSLVRLCAPCLQPSMGRPMCACVVACSAGALPSLYRAVCVCLCVCMHACLSHLSPISTHILHHPQYPQCCKLLSDLVVSLVPVTLLELEHMLLHTQGHTHTHKLIHAHTGLLRSSASASTLLASHVSARAGFATRSNQLKYSADAAYRCARCVYAVCHLQCEQNSLLAVCVPDMI